MYKIPICILLASIAAFSCSDGTEDPEVAWNLESEDPDIRRAEGVSFVIGKEFYIGAGFEIAGGAPERSFWAFNVETKKWREISNPGIYAIGSVGFAINGRGYMLVNNDDWDGTGVRVNRLMLEYNPNTDRWTTMKSFPGVTSVGSTSFVINNKGYVLAGPSFNFSQEPDLWEYNPANDEWTEKADLPEGPARGFCSSFVIGDVTYVVGGYNYSGSLSREVWAYNSASNEWSKKNDFPGEARMSTFGFAINGMGYIGAGSKGPGTSSDRVVKEFWQYNPKADTWQQLSDVKGEALVSCIEYAAGNKAYIFGGFISGSNSSTSPQLWSFEPSEQ